MRRSRSTRPAARGWRGRWRRRGRRRRGRAWAARGARAASGPSAAPGPWPPPAAADRALDLLRRVGGARDPRAGRRRSITTPRAWPTANADRALAPKYRSSSATQSTACSSISSLTRAWMAASRRSGAAPARRAMTPPSWASRRPPRRSDHAVAGVRGAGIDAEDEHVKTGFCVADRTPPRVGSPSCPRPSLPSPVRARAERCASRSPLRSWTPATATARAASAAAACPWTMNGMVPAEALRVVAGAEAMRTWRPEGGFPKSFCGECGGHVFAGQFRAARAWRASASARCTAIPASRRSGASGSAPRPPWIEIPDDGLAAHRRQPLGLGALAAEAPEPPATRTPSRGRPAPTAGRPDGRTTSSPGPAPRPTA